MNVREITVKYLKEHGFDGLYNHDGGCGCILADLAPCCECHVLDCRPGYRVDTPDDPEGFDYHIVESLEGWRAQKERGRAEQEDPAPRSLRSPWTANG